MTANGSCLCRILVLKRFEMIVHVLVIPCKQDFEGFTEITLSISHGCSKLSIYL